jgi:hypothetical protein
MRMCRIAMLIALLLPAAVSAQTTAVQKWKAVFVGPKDHRPKMMSGATFSISQVAGGSTVSAARTDGTGWPGELDVSDVKLAGEHVSFVGTGRTGWTVNGVPHCCPRLVFTGTIDGDEMTLTMTWATTEHPDGSTASVYAMVAKRVRD